MKRKLLLLCTLTLLNVYTHAQSFFPSVFNEPLTGMDLLRDENPYILKQIRTTSNAAWVNSKLFVKKRASGTDYLVFDRTANWISANWKDEQLTKDSLVLDNNNRIVIIFEEAKNIYNGTTYYNKNKYFYSYDSQNRLEKISVQTTNSPTSTNYTDNYVYVINYINGVRTSDSIYVVANEASYVRAYTYNTGKLITELGIQSGDTVARTDYNYEGGLLKSIIGSEFSETADAWEINQTDSFEYNSSNLIAQHTIWSSYTSNNVFSPIVKEKYGYTSNNKLNEIIMLQDTNSVWKNKSKIVVTYDNMNKATVAYGYVAIDENTWDTEATEKYIFEEVVTGIQSVTKPTRALNIFPNPAANEINIAALPNATLYLFDVTGKVVLWTEVNNGKVDVSGLENGIYTAQLVNALNNTSAVSKIVISK